MLEHNAPLPAGFLLDTESGRLDTHLHLTHPKGFSLCIQFKHKGVVIDAFPKRGAILRPLASTYFFSTDLEEAIAGETCPECGGEVEAVEQMCQHGVHLVCQGECGAWYDEDLQEITSEDCEEEDNA